MELIRFAPAERLASDTVDGSILLGASNPASQNEDYDFNYEYKFLI